MKAIALAVLATLGNAVVVHAGEFPPMTVPQTLGVCIPGQKLEDVDFERIHESGFRWIRRGVQWNNVEQEKGVYDFSGGDKLLAKCEEAGLGLMITLSFGNKLYEPDRHWMDVSTEVAREGFANYAAAMAKHYKGRKVVFEVWNEANSKFFRSDKETIQGQAEDFMLMQNLAVKKMREADPDCVILGGGAVINIGWKKTIDWLEVCLEMGTLKNTDAISFHAYGEPSTNDDVELNIQRHHDLQQQIKRHGAENGFPLVQTEYGINVQFNHWDEKDHAKREVLQAEAVVRNYLVSLMCGWRFNMHYEWKSRSESTRGDKGLIRRDDTATPALVAFKTITDTLNGYTYQRQIEGFGEGNYVVLFQKGDQRMLAAWTTDEKATHDIELEVTAQKPVPTVAMLGEKASAAPANGKLTLTLSGSPQYVDASTLKLPE